AVPTTTPPPPTLTPALATSTWTVVPPTWTPIPTGTATLPPTATATTPATATATATTPAPVAALTCTLVPPVIDGTLNVGVEWPGTPLFTFQPAVTGPERIVRVYGVRDATHLYFAFLINDAVNEGSDAARLYLDTTNNGNDPDTADRFFQVNRNGDRLIWPGIGSNIDGQGWNSTYSSSNWASAVGEPGNGQWVVEMSIDAVAELGALANPFGLMAEVFYTGDTSAYPSTASGTQANTWQDIGNAICTP
ncbi:MAG: hypothetical protein KC410_16425, partial [Anaerolineales bacterium]|nr:hypothetical protein [Anaerolineales bacterium]